jgi:hypothetical protein
MLAVVVAGLKERPLLLLLPLVGLEVGAQARLAQTQLQRVRQIEAVGVEETEAAARRVVQASLLLN